MGWPIIPALVLTDTTTWSKATGWTVDKALGRVPVYGPVGPPIACAVESSGAAMVDAHGRTGMVVQHSITFTAAAFPGLHIRDQGTWIEGGKTLTVVGVQPSGDALGRIYVVTCEERPIL